MKKLSIIWLTTVGAILLTFILFVTLVRSSGDVINSTGSSAMVPLMTSFNKYQKADVIADSGGSSRGIEMIKRSETDIGTASRDPKLENTPGLKTITIAWDAIVIIYNTPWDLEQNLVINKENISNLYLLFSGLEQFSFKDFGISDERIKDKKLVPIPRTGGATSSGTTDAFINDSHLLENPNEKTKQALSLLKTGSYGKYISQTSNEANQQAYAKVKDTKYSISYVSFGFALAQQKKPSSEESFSKIDSRIHIASYENSTNLNVYQPLLNNIGLDGYGWRRPFNAIVEIKDSKPLSQKIEDFIFWIFEQSDLIKKAGYIPIQEEEKKTMYRNEDLEDLFWISDFELGYSGVKVSS